MSYTPTNWKAGDTVTSTKLNKMEQGIAASGGGLLESLSDVDLSNPTNGQTLVYNSTSGKWENGSGGGVLIVGSVDTGSAFMLDKTWREIHDALSTNTVSVYAGESDVSFQYPIFAAFHDMETGKYVIITFGLFNAGTLQFIADSENGYPVLDQST